MTHSASMGEATLPPLVPGPYRKRIGLISIVACLGGLLFGYDTGVANGAEGPMQTELGLGCGSSTGMTFRSFGDVSGGHAARSQAC